MRKCDADPNGSVITVIGGCVRLQLTKAALTSKQHPKISFEKVQISSISISDDSCKHFIVTILLIIILSIKKTSIKLN